MNLFKGVIALAALATLAIPHQPAKAYENPHKTLIDTLEEVGIKVVTESPQCEGRYGFFAPYLNGEPVIGLCESNITDMQTLYATVRHEAIHVAQLCKAMRGLPQSVAGYALLKPEVNHYYMSRAQDNGWHILGYAEEDWEIESEAFVLANNWTAQQIETQVRKYCL